MQYFVMLPHFRRPLLLVFTAAICLAVTLPGSAQSRAAVTVADYERAERFLNYNTNPLVTNGAVRATWMPGDRFWYRNQTATGHEFILVDAAKATRARGLRSRRRRQGADGRHG